MCLAIPGKIIKIEKGFATIDYSGEQRKASTELVDVEPGDYVIVQAQFVIQKIPEKEALEAIKVWQKR
nr:HypC/HybG/HupF family hydrogenase formation chaperone [Nanoarchaeota archaeon]